MRWNEKDPVAYKSPESVPRGRDFLIQIDERAESVVVPVYGVGVPFHISVIKNVTSTNDTDHAFVRIIFQSPSGTSLHATPPMVMRHIDQAFLKEISFRCTDVRHASNVVQKIKTLRRNVMQRQSEARERATLVTQEKLVQSRGRVPTLSDIWIRPTFGGRGKKLTGALEAHTNGFRYHAPKGEQLDIMYKNIKQAFFQPAEKEMICLIHFHLHDDIMVGKKKSKEVQFYTEVMEVVQTLDAGRRNAYDPDEIEEEQRERERRNTVNNSFNSFVKKIQDLWERDHRELNLEFDIPFRELGFAGVPFKSTSFLIPTVYCLVDLIEMPFFVLTLSEVAVVNLERVGFGLKNFDMVFVFKNFEKDPHRVDAIPSASLEQVKEWLTSMNLKYYENKMNLVWKPILKTIKDDPEDFIKNGGWEFLNMEASDDEDEEEEVSTHSLCHAPHNRMNANHNVHSHTQLSLTLSVSLPHTHTLCIFASLPCPPCLPCSPLLVLDPRRVRVLSQTLGRAKRRRATMMTTTAYSTKRRRMTMRFTTRRRRRGWIGTRWRRRQGGLIGTREATTATTTGAQAGE